MRSSSKEGSYFFQSLEACMDLVGSTVTGFSESSGDGALVTLAVAASVFLGWRALSLLTHESLAVASVYSTFLLFVYEVESCGAAPRIIWPVRAWVTVVVAWTTYQILLWRSTMRSLYNRWEPESPSFARCPSLEDREQDGRAHALDMSHVHLSLVDFMWAVIFVGLPLQFHFFFGGSGRSLGLLKVSLFSVMKSLHRPVQSQDHREVAAAFVLETTMAVFVVDGCEEREDGSVEVRFGIPSVKYVDSNFKVVEGRSPIHPSFTMPPH